MKTVIIALPVEDDTDIFEIQDVINEAFPSGEDDSRNCVVYQGVEALMHDLGLEYSND